MREGVFILFLGKAASVQRKSAPILVRGARVEEESAPFQVGSARVV